MSWGKIIAPLIPTLLLLGVVGGGVVYVQGLLSGKASVVKERDQLALRNADLVAANELTRRAMEAGAAEQVDLREQIARLKKATPGARPVAVVHGDTGQLVPQLQLTLEDRPAIQSDVQLWETKGKAIGVLGHSKVTVGERVVVEGDWDRKLTQAEIEKLAPPPGLGATLNMDLGQAIRVGAALRPFKIFGRQVELVVQAPPLNDGRFELRKTSATLIVR